MDFGPDSYRVRMFDVGYCEFRISDIRCRILLIWEEEADESIYWLELLEETGLISGYHVSILKREGQRTFRDIYGYRKNRESESTKNKGR